jgi:hypothetical protein
MTYVYRTNGDFPCKKMDLEATGDYSDIVLQVTPYTPSVKQGRTWIEIKLFAPKITEAMAITAISKALNVKTTQIILL